jgi:hypothetical protein
LKSRCQYEVPVFFLSAIEKYVYPTFNVASPVFSGKDGGEAVPDTDQVPAGVLYNLRRRSQGGPGPSSESHAGKDLAVAVISLTLFYV